MKCKCPMCEKIHGLYLQFEWTGNGIPRKYCQSCKLKKQVIEDVKIYKIKVIEFIHHEKCIGCFTIYSKMGFTGE